MGSPLAGFPSNKEVWFLDDFSEVISHLAILLTDILSLQYSGFFDVT